MDNKPKEQTNCSAVMGTKKLTLANQRKKIWGKYGGNNYSGVSRILILSYSIVIMSLHFPDYPETHGNWFSGPARSLWLPVSFCVYTANLLDVSFFFFFFFWQTLTDGQMHLSLTIFSVGKPIATSVLVLDWWNTCKRFVCCINANQYLCLAPKLKVDFRLINYKQL